jgi:diguanylate cyclase (GGDEF)-like protein
MLTSKLRRGVGIRYVMLAVVAIPLASFLILAVGTVRNANDEVAAAERANAAGSEVTAYTTLAAAVSVEHYWAGATVAVREFGLDPAALDGVLGADVMQEWARAQGVVDDQRASIDVDELGALLAEARSTVDVGVDGAYVKAEQVVTARVDEAKQRLGAAALAVDDPEKMVTAVAALSGSIDLRSQVFDLVADLFGARFPADAVTGSPAAGLIAARSRYDEVARGLGRDAASWPALSDALASISEDPHTEAVFADVDREIGLLGTPPAPQNQASELLRQATTFANSLAVLDRFGGAVEIASDDLAATGADLTAQAEDTRLHVVVAIALVGSVTIGIVVAIGRWMVGSLDGISASASAMNDGDLERPAPVKGPTEVRVAAQALNGAAANIRSAERQVLTLASGDLSEPTGVDVVPGRLGASLQAAFDRLAESMQDREQLRRELHQEANHDGLTGLPNRSAIMKGLATAVERVARDSGRVAVLFVDVDGFKFINDEHGHAVGDEVLKGIARRVRRAARSGDVVGRLGGDELVVIADPVNGMGDALGLARRIRRAVSRPLPTAAGLTPTISIGLALGSGGATTPEQLLHDADLAVYEAKGAGGNVIEVCTPELRRASDHRQAVEKALAQAIAGNELRIALQAIVAADGSAVTGVEALVRWPQPDGTIRQPVEFVPIAERGNLVIDLDRWVIGETIGLLAAWGHDPRTSALSASVNLSARHASVAAFADHILETLERHHVEPGRLVVELTESALIANLDHVVDELTRLRAHGVSVAVDDFGTGYTSLALLHQLPVDTLKLDRVLTTDLGDERVLAVVALIVDTAHLIGLSVTAEGVETVRQVEQLRELGVDALQGFLLHRPCGVGEVVAELSQLGDAIGEPEGVGSP